jgi:hypothetical protein
LFQSILPPTDKMDLDFVGWIYWATKNLEPSQKLPYLWRLIELANEMSNSYDNKLWEIVQKQKGSLVDQYISGQRVQQNQTVTAFMKDELALAMKSCKDFWINLPPSTTT